MNCKCNGTSREIKINGNVYFICNSCGSMLLIGYSTNN